MFNRILIANRGEIACRIARTCRRLGIETVAVYSYADVDALHVQMADHAVALHGASIADGYLDIEQIVAAARRSGAQAVHPGYGFLAENADFALACEAAGIRFVGPDANAIRAMGDKAEARRLARAVGVPVVPGVEEDATAAGDRASDGTGDRPGHRPGDRPGDRNSALLAATAQLAYPLMVKACAGGGGRGMRKVEHAEALADAIDIARREAMAAFGSDALIVERYIEHPRHVEVQILGDSHGTVLHLHERDCSIQRRHQKLIEEAPAPGLTQDTRDALHAAALALANAIGYENAGTVEFVLDARDQSFYFLEVNTRLQVEHPVTEAILGLDLVEWQLRIAAGEALPFSQDELQPVGWAMEARINAEDPAQDFRPATGTVHHIGFNAALSSTTGLSEKYISDIRLDSGVEAGSAVAPWYDSMLGKLIVHGHDRADAAARLAQALASLSLMGVRSNIAFLADLVRKPAFSQALVNTDFITDHFANGWQASPSRDDLAMAAALILGPGSPDNDRKRSPGPWRSLTGFRLFAASGQRGGWRMILADETDTAHAVWVQAHDTERHMVVDVPDAPPPAFTSAHVVSAVAVGEVVMLTVDGRQFCVATFRQGDTLHLYGEAGWHAFEWLDARDALNDSDSGNNALDGPLRSPVPGVIASVEVKVGDSLPAGASVVVIESMKMYQTLCAPQAAQVVAVHCSAGEAVAVGQALVTLQASDEDAP